MNVAGHIAVAQVFANVSDGSVDDQARILLGSTLPDICNIAQVRLANRSMSEHIQHGIELHHQTDQVFHAHRWFRDLMAKTMDTLVQRGVRRGPARACAHIGPELLLDGALTNRPEVASAAESAFASIGTSMGFLTSMVDKADQKKWTQTLRRLHEAKGPLDYSDPDTVAHRMERILRHRPRLSLSQSEIEPVAETLHSIQPVVTEDANWLVRDLQNTLIADLDER